MIKKLILVSLLLVSTNIFAKLDPGIQNRNSGDIISVRNDSEAAAWCDFNKQIVVLPPSILCVYTGMTKTSND